jgi:hypothetical protein
MTFLFAEADVHCGRRIKEQSKRGGTRFARSDPLTGGGFESSCVETDLFPGFPRS